MARLSRAMQWDVHYPYLVGMDFIPVIRTGPFDRVEQRGFSHHQVLDREILYRRALTTSYVAVMDEGERHSLMNDVVEVVESLDDPITLSYVPTVYRASAR